MVVQCINSVDNELNNSTVKCGA